MSTALIFVLTLVCLGAMSRDQRTDTKDDIIRVERSDDISNADLQSLLQQQSAVIQQQSATIQALQADVTALKSTTGTRLAFLENRARKQVAFSVTFTEDGTALNIAQNAPIKFSHVITNTGNGYDQHTGIFTAPTSGLYAFLLMAREHSSSTYAVTIGLLKSTTVLCETNIEGTGYGQWDKGSCMATVGLSKGETIHAQRLGGSVNIDKGWMTNFHGMLIAADL